MRILLTDAPEAASRWFGEPPSGIAPGPSAGLDPEVGGVAAAVFGRPPVEPFAPAERGGPVRIELPSWRPPGRFQTLFLVDRAERSNLDLLADLLRRNLPVPDGLVCASIRGHGFLGRFDRTWQALDGNLHAVLHLAPCVEPRRVGAAFTALAAVACVEAVARLAPGTAPPRIKWINDLVLDGCKVGGVLARQVYREPVVTNLLLGIGVNVWAEPALRPDPFVPATGCLARLRPRVDWSPGGFLAVLLERIEHWYEQVLHHGPGALLDAYRKEAGFLHRRVRLYEDRFGLEEGGIAGRRLLARGRVIGVEDDLSLMIEGCPAPVQSGRMAFEEDCRSVTER